MVAVSSFGRAVHFLTLIQANRRISVRRLAEELGVSVRQVYNLIKLATPHIPIRLENGILIRNELKRPKVCSKGKPILS